MRRAWMTGISIGLLIASWASAAEPVVMTANGTYNVREAPFNAAGNGATDDTAAFQAAMNAAANDGGGVVTVPAGKYRIATHLTVPANVTLEGVWRVPSRGAPPDAGSTLLASEGAGNASGTPFITLNASATLSGLNIYYPGQTLPTPTAYPWTVRGNGERCSIKNVTIVNPYLAVDFGTNPCPLHSINGLYAHALYRGLFVDQCDPGGRIENIHFWPFWDLGGSVWPFTRTHAIAYQFGNVKGEMAVNLFGIFYSTTFQFADFGHGPGSGVYTNVYPDITPLAYKIEEVDPAAGISIVNGLAMSTAQVDATNTGPVKFTGCVFIGSDTAVNNGYITWRQADLQGSGTVSFESCTFSGWDNPKVAEAAPQGTACIKSNCKSLIVTGNEFIASRTGQPKIELGANTEEAVIAANRMRYGVIIQNNAPPTADVQLGLNVGGTGKSNAPAAPEGSR